MKKIGLDEGNNMVKGDFTPYHASIQLCLIHTTFLSLHSFSKLMNLKHDTEKKNTMIGVVHSKDGLL